MSHSDRVAAALLRELPPDVGAFAMRVGDATVVGAVADEIVIVPAGDPAPLAESGLAALDELTSGFWAGFLSFELGHRIERVVTHFERGASAEDPAVPDVGFARFDARVVIAADGSVTIDGDGVGRPLLERALRDLALTDGRASHHVHGPTQWWSSLSRDEYEARVGEILELLTAGECYQVNLTRRLTTDRALDPVALYAALADRHPSPHSAFLRLETGTQSLAVVSASPERFLRRDGALVETRPIKGTAASAARLRASEKDRAENVMIVDLARNDLGRVCIAGSINVPVLCAVEAHPGLHHLVSTVRGTLRADVSTGDLVRATFPPASVTGAPKPRVLQAIEDLEPVRRGVYCGAIGWFDTVNDTADLAVAIRTFTILGQGSRTPSGSLADGCTHFGVGGGIVADSRPGAEWEETELKAARLLAVARGDTHERGLAPVALAAT